jgi:hypothetical protein
MATGIKETFAAVVGETLAENDDIVFDSHDRAVLGGAVRWPLKPRSTISM